jgi:hypothetical protein
MAGIELMCLILHCPHSGLMGWDICLFVRVRQVSSAKERTGEWVKAIDVEILRCVQVIYLNYQAYFLHKDWIWDLSLLETLC